MLEQELVRYGYLILFFGVMIEGEAFLLAAAFLAHRGYFHIAAVIAVAALGNLVADQIYYMLARAKGQEYFSRKAAEDPKIKRLHAWVDRRGAVLLFVSRFIYGFRIAIPAACGAAGMPARVFVPVNTAGSLLWAVIVGVGGYAFGNAVDLLLSDLRRYEWSIAVALVVSGLVIALATSRRVHQRLRSIRRPAQLVIEATADMFAAAHHAGRFALTRPTVRLAALVVLLGAINIATAVFAWHFTLLTDLADAMPLALTHRTRPVTLLAGLVLVALGRGLARRKRVAWVLALVTVGLTAVLHLGHGVSLIRATVSLVLFAELWRHQGLFTARSDAVRLRQAAVAAAVLVVALTVYGVAGLHRHHYARPGLLQAVAETWRVAAFQDPAWLVLDSHGAAFASSLRLLSLLSAVGLLGMALAPVVLRGDPAEDLEPVRRIAWADGVDSLSYFAKQADKRHLLVDGRAFVGYRVEGRVAIAAGDPVGPRDAIPAAIEAFLALCTANDWVPVFYETSPHHLETYRELGLRWFKVGEEAVVPLAGFSLQGAKVAKVRQAINKFEREQPDIRITEYRRESPDPEIDDQLSEISAEWLGTKRGRELGFNLGIFSVDELADKRTFLAMTSSEYAWAFITWLPYNQGRAVVLDAMRRRTMAPAGVMEQLIGRSMLAFKDEGLEVASLATAPLANVDEASGVSVYDRSVRLVFERFSAVYGYRSLFHFKRKFGPEWEGRYLVFPRPDLLPRIAYALVAVHTPGGLLSYLKR